MISIKLFTKAKEYNKPILIYQSMKRNIKEYITCTGTNLTAESITEKEISDMPACAYDLTLTYSIDIKSYPLYLSKCTFKSTTSNYSGGAIYIAYPDRQTTPKEKSLIELCTFLNCETKNEGGAICVNGNKNIFLLDILNCTFKENDANGPSSSGGALFIESVSGTISKCTFIDNKSGVGTSFSKGYLLYFDYHFAADDGKFNLAFTNNEIIQNFKFTFEKTISLVYFIANQDIDFSFNYNTITISRTTQYPKNFYLFEKDRYITFDASSYEFLNNCVIGDVKIKKDDPDDINFENQCPPEPTQTSEIESSETTEVIESSETTEVIESSETTEVIESSETTEVIESSETTEVIESSETTEVIESSETTEVIESSETTEVIESSETTEAIESSEITQSSSETELLPSEEPVEPVFGPICYVTYDTINQTLYSRCTYLNENKEVVVHIVSTNFTDFKNESHGGAVYVENCGLEANEANFTRCISVSGGGGAIYASNERGKCMITLENLHFYECKAVYGGAIFIYSSIQTNEVFVSHCIFMLNEAYQNYDENGLFGGGAVYIASSQTNFSKCTFRYNKGPSGSIKFDLKLIEKPSNLHKLDVKRNTDSIVVCGCDFEINKESKSAIYCFIDNAEIQMEIKECSFKGKLQKGMHYIDGISTNRKKPTISVCSCNFQCEMKIAINTDLIEKVDSNTFIAKASNLMNIMIYLAIVIVALILLLLPIKKLRTYEKQEENLSQKISFESLNSEKELHDFENPISAK